MILTAALVYTLATASAEDKCPDGRAAGPVAIAGKIETVVRAGVGDPCPDKRAAGTEAEQSQLLELLRYRLRFHLEKMIAKAQNPDEAALRAKFFDMRADLSLRGAEVRVDRGTLVVEPDLYPRHDEEFAALEKIGPDDLARIRSRIGARVARANSQFKIDGDKTAGLRLREDLRQAGATGYQERVAADPLLRYVGPDLKIGDAAKALRTELEQGRDELPKLQLSPPYGKGVGLIYATDLAANAVTEHPELCGAFNSLLARARGMRRGVGFLSAAVTPLSAFCRSPAKFLSWTTLWAGVACGVASYGLSTAISRIPGADFKRVRLLYGVPFDPYPVGGAVAEAK